MDLKEMYIGFKDLCCVLLAQVRSNTIINFLFHKIKDFLEKQCNCEACTTQASLKIEKRRRTSRQLAVSILMKGQ
jgi:hypothetical protein